MKARQSPENELANYCKKLRLLEQKDPLGKVRRKKNSGFPCKRLGLWKTPFCYEEDSVMPEPHSKKSYFDIGVTLIAASP